MGKRIVAVGSGPAGASFALALARKGIGCTLIDASAFPRPKLCGGGITRKTRDIVIPLLGEDAYLATVKSTSSDIEIRYDGKRAALFTTGIPIDFVDRSLYDLAFVDAFRKMGGDFRPGVRAKGIDSANKVLETSAGPMEYDILVCADGAASRMRKCFEPQYRPECFCYEYKTADTEGNLIRIDFFSTMKGYSWSFPNGADRVIGTGSFYRKPADARALRTFLDVYGPPPDKLGGAFIPLGINPALGPVADGCVFFLGDAAGLANPVTGEGLFLASKSALILSGYIAGDLSRAQYRTAMRAIGRNLTLYSRAQDIVFRPGIWKKLTADGKSRSGFRRICDGIISRDKNPIGFFLGHFVRKFARIVKPPLPGK